MARHAPVTARQSPDTADLRAERARRMEQIRKLEWEFDRHPSFEAAGELRQQRVALSDCESHIAQVTEEVAATALLEKARGRAAQLSGGDTH